MMLIVRCQTADFRRPVVPNAEVKIETEDGSVILNTQ
ncbi:hypothetical protein X551_03508 [Methylibium sp. T29]|nr:hypothetical protein X551_03508 [Methylibium sp. T29]EWS61736.1 hypothetical protein Y694_00522 [Methylibium sp. T29-B]